MTEMIYSMDGHYRRGHVLNINVSVFTRMPRHSGILTSIQAAMPSLQKPFQPYPTAHRTLD